MDQKTPDILLIVSDDVNFNLLTQAKSPNIDRLMTTGADFTKLFNYGGENGAVCKSSRKMMLYGVPWDHKGPQGPAFPEVLKKNGYTTFATGKWHSPASLFHRCFQDYRTVFFGGQVSKKSILESPKKKIKLGKKLPGGIFTESLTNFIRNYKSVKPYFAYVGFTEPHDPLTLVDEDTPRSTLPGNFSNKHQFDFGQGVHRDEKMLRKPLRKEAVLKNIRKYQSMITYLDTNIGKIIDSIKRPTVLMLTTDNGICKGNHGLMGKQNLYQESVHVPFTMWSNSLSLSGNCAKLC